jgi:predicted dehydrogenase
MSGVVVTGVCDLSRSMAEAAASRFGVGRWFTDHRTMLEELRPDVVHVTTPPTSHYRLAKDALAAGAHVLVEKPATVEYEELEDLLMQARVHGRSVVEDYNYVFNEPVQRVLGLIESGEFGRVQHVEVALCLDIVSKGGAFVDENAPHPCLSMEGGAIADFLPHLASLAHAFVGKHKGVGTIWAKRGNSVLPSDEFRALVNAERGTAELVFSAHSQPDAFQVRVYGERMRASVNLFEPRLTIDRVRPGCAKPLVPVFNGLEEGRVARREAVRGLVRKLSGGPGAYEGLWQLLRRTYAALAAGGTMPVTMQQVSEVNQLVAAMKEKENSLESASDRGERLSGTARRFGVPSARAQRPGAGAAGGEGKRAADGVEGRGRVPGRPAGQQQLG